MTEKQKRFGTRILFGVICSSAGGALGALLGVPFGPVGIALGCKIGATAGAAVAALPNDDSPGSSGDYGGAHA
jgi:hypothetical protein